MAKARFYKVEVALNKMSTTVAHVAEWEVPVLIAQWGDDARIVEGDEGMTIEDIKLPEPRDEFERLAQRYGPKHEDTPYVAGVYGNFGPGVNALRDAMIRATQPLPPPIEEEVEALGSGEGSLDAGVGEAGVNANEGGDLDDDLTDLTGEGSNETVAA